MLTSHICNTYKKKTCFYIVHVVMKMVFYFILNKAILYVNIYKIRGTGEGFW